MDQNETLNVLATQNQMFSTNPNVCQQQLQMFGSNQNEPLKLNVLATGSVYVPCQQSALFLSFSSASHLCSAYLSSYQLSL